jgi:chondroitin 4-sulfotransferase 11
MVISDRKRFIFIHIPKTAGMSITRALKQAAPDALNRLPGVAGGPQPQRHLFAVELRRQIGEKRWPSYFSFAFVRNPWARLVSWYNMCLERPTNRFMLYVKENARTFDDFLLLSDDLAQRTRLNQVDYVIDEAGNQIVDFIGRYETISQDFTKICAKLAIRPLLPHINATSRVDYRQYYTPTSQRLVAERFRPDIERFDYSFN